MPENKKVWIIIPAYNEARNLRGVVEGIRENLKGFSHEIFIINDGSQDDTLLIAQHLAKQFPVRVLNHEINRGVAEAFRTGIKQAARFAAKDDVVIIMEGDGTSDPSLLPNMARRIATGADIVIASRYQPGGKYKDFPLKRLLLSQGANIVFRIFFPTPGVRDYSIFYRAYRASILQQALKKYGEKFITVQTFFANIEILFHLKPFMKITEEIPLVYDYSKKQSKSGMKIWKNFKSYLVFVTKHVLSLVRE